MGLFGKIKNIFYDIEEVEVPVKKEEELVERPKIEELNVEETHKETVPDSKIDTTVSERELFKSKNTFNFPIFEADEVEEPEPIIQKPKPETMSRVRENSYYEEPRREIRIDRSMETPKQDKVFTPSPVISPVYGILDKNYKREEVIEKREVHTPLKTSEKNYDYVRRKAFGTLEDELENTMTKIETPKSTLELTQDLTESIEKIEESSKNIEDLLAEVDKPKVTVEEMEERYKDRIEKEDIDEKEELMDNTLEHDLFNLIDSMYDNKEE